MKAEAPTTKRVVSRKRQFGRIDLAAISRLPDADHRAQSALEKAMSGLESAAARGALLQGALEKIRDLLVDNARLSRDLARMARQLSRARTFAYYDELTCLPNRRLLQDHFRQARAHAQRRHERMALLFIDLDGFKRVNDRFGHLAGDCILKQVAARLETSVRDDETASRFGGDEFVVLLNGCQDENAARIAVERIRTLLSEAYTLHGTPLELTVSVGMAIYPDDGRSMTELIQASDMSMLCEKRRDLLPPEGP